MDVKVYGKNIELNSEAESYIQKKFKRLERHLKSISSARLELSRTSARSQSDRIVSQMTLNRRWIHPERTRERPKLDSLVKTRFEEVPAI